MTVRGSWRAPASGDDDRGNDEVRRLVAVVATQPAVPDIDTDRCLGLRTSRSPAVLGCVGNTVNADRLPPASLSDVDDEDALQGGGTDALAACGCAVCALTAAASGSAR